VSEEELPEGQKVQTWCCERSHEKTMVMISSSLAGKKARYNYGNGESISQSDKDYNSATGIA
jgi:hypothetical protein